MNKESTGAKRIIIYCRESRDEDGEHFGRIETQRDILLRFVRDRGIEGEIEVILDDNVSGTDFTRLAGIAARAEVGTLDILVFKDASRLGRNLRESLNFLHRMERCGVEVLFESETYDPELFPLLAWFNERRAAEDSRKVRRVFRHLMQTGELVIRAPYGYRKASGALEPEPLSAGTVRRIFTDYLSGFSTGEIAECLNREEVPTPSAHPGRECANSSGAWNRQHVRRILSDSAYTGDMCYHKTTKPSFQSKAVKRNPREDWIVLENHHEALVSREIFRRAQALSARARKSRAGPEKLCFSGILYCGGCGARMVQRRRSGRAAGYVCAAYQRSGRAACESHFIREDALQAAARGILAPMLRDERLAKRLQTARRPSGEPLAQAKRLVSQYERAVMRIYDDMLERPGQMPAALYERKLAEYTAKLAAAQASLDKLQAVADQSPEALTEWLAGTPFYLERRLLHALFARIVLYLPGEQPETVGNPAKKGLLVFTPGTPDGSAEHRF